MALTSVWVPLASRKAMLAANRSAIPVFMEIQKAHGHLIAKVHQLLGAHRLQKQQAALLECALREPVLRIQRWYYTADGRLMEMSDSLHPQPPCGRARGVRQADRRQPRRGRAHMNVSAAELMRNQAASRFDRGLACGPGANMAKYLCSEASWEAAEAAMTTHGGFGVATDYDIERKWQETRLFRTAPISNNLVLAYVAQHVLQMPRSY